MTIDAGDRQKQANPIAINPRPNSRTAAIAGNASPSPAACAPPTLKAATTPTTASHLKRAESIRQSPIGRAWFKEMSPPVRPYRRGQPDDAADEIRYAHRPTPPC